MLRPRRSVRNGALEKKASVSSSTSNPIPSPPSPPRSSNHEDEHEEVEQEQPLRLLEPRECVGRTIHIGLNEEIELLFKNSVSSEVSSPIVTDLKTAQTDVVPYEAIASSDPPKFQRTGNFIRYIEPTQNELDEMVEYEMDEMVNVAFDIRFSHLAFRVCTKGSRLAETGESRTRQTQSPSSD